jgi:hypothetical protein
MEGIKYCEHCKWFDNESGVGLCWNENAYLSGRSFVKENNGEMPDIARESSYSCGKEGKFWEEA